MPAVCLLVAVDASLIQYRDDPLAMLVPRHVSVPPTQVLSFRLVDFSSTGTALSATECYNRRVFFPFDEKTTTLTMTHLRPQCENSQRRGACQVFPGNQRISVMKPAASLLLCLVATNLMAQRLVQNPTRDSSHPVGQIPIYFEQNDGQADKTAKFLAVNGRLKALITKNGLEFPRGNTFISMQVRHGSVTSFQPEEPAAGVSQFYYLGRQMLTGLKHYERVRGHNIRPGIDILFRSNDTELEYDFDVHPGGRPDLLRLGFGGKRSLDLEKNGDIRLISENDELRLRKPEAWQNIGDKRRRIECDYRISANGDVAFTLGHYDHFRDLTIDPIISFSTAYLSSGGDGA